MRDPFTAGGVWLRAALHAHTTNSDGELPPPTLVRHYERAGYDVLAITDHWVRTEGSSTDSLLVLPSIELDAAMGLPGRDSHVLGFGVESQPEKPEGAYPSLLDTVAWVRANGGVPYLAHPYWSGLRAEEFQEVDGLAGLEVYNAGCELEVGRGLAAVHWDDALDAGQPLLAIAADDSHHPGFDSGFAWTWLRAAERSREAVLSALREGSFYSSNGPAIYELSVADAVVEIRTSPARSITLLTGRSRGASVHAGRLGYCYRGEVLERAEDGLIVAARVAAPRGAPYARLEVANAAGGKAWTNPLW